uniref:Uncharacterized protein n=1 Tax=Adineta vaga TaxID=104782 RepID=B3G4G3_ADIVA|nr:hypothetical protein [Adineta vaga]
MGQWLKSRTYFENLALHRMNDPHIQFGTGLCCRVFGEIDRALFHFHQAYDLIMHTESECLILKSKICCNLLRTYQDLGDFTKAIAFGDEALDFYRRAGEHGNEFGIAKVLINLELLNFNKGNDDVCLDYLERALILLKRISLFDGPEISECYKFFSFAHYHKRDYDKALDCLLKESQITARLAPTSYPHTAATENNIGKQYYKQGKIKEALTQFRLAVDISERMGTTKSGNQIVLLNKIDEAEKYYEEALHLTKKVFSSSVDHINLAYILKNQGEIHFAKGNFVGALQLYEQAHDVYKRIFIHDDNQRDIAKCQYLIGLTHLECNNIENATVALEKALYMWTKVLHSDHPDLALSHQSMGDLYMYKQNGEIKAIEHLKFALTIYEKQLPSDHEKLTDLKGKLAKLES